KKRRDQYRQKREAEALALNSSSEAGTPASSRMRQSLYNLNHEFKKKAKQPCGRTENQFPNVGDFVKLTAQIHKAQKIYYATVIEINKDSNNFSVRFLQRSGTKYSFGEIEDVGLIVSGPPDFYSWEVLNNSQWSIDHREHYTFFL
ncbi:hypothetical protein RRG08_002890, partial [Elysia crispata]